MLLIASAFGILITIILFVCSIKAANKVTRYLAFYFLIISLYVLVHYITVYSGNTFWIAICFINPGFLFLLPGPILYFYVRGTLTGTAEISKKDWIHFVPAILHFIILLPWLFTDFASKEALARIVIESPESIFENDYFKPVIPFYSSFLLRSLSGMGYAIYSVTLIYKHHQHKVDITNKQQHGAVVWLNLFVFSQAILFLAYMVSVIITHNDHMQSLLYGHSALFHISQGMVLGILQIIFLIFPWALYGVPKHLSVANLQSSIV